MILHDFEDASACTPPGLDASVFTAKLHNTQGRADLIFDCFREGQQIVQAGRNPKKRLLSTSPSCSAHVLSQFWDARSTAFAFYTYWVPDPCGFCEGRVVANLRATDSPKPQASEGCRRKGLSFLSLYR